MQDFQLYLFVKSNFYSEIEDWINDAIQFKFEKLEYKDKTKLIEGCFSCKNWICHNCEESNMNSKNPLNCSKCAAFKHIDIFPSLISSNKRDIHRDDLECIKNWREKEKLIVCSKDVRHEERADSWYIIHSEWLKDWKMFVNNKWSKVANGARISQIEELGILEPGPITN